MAICQWFFDAFCVFTRGYDIHRSVDMPQVHLENCALISADFASLRADQCLLDDAVPRRNG